MPEITPGHIRSGRRDAAGQKGADLIHILPEIFILYGVLLMGRKSHGHSQKKQQGSRAGQELYARFVFGQLVLLLEAWSRAGGALPQEAAPTMGPKYDRIASVLAYLKNHREERLRLEDVAREFFVTPAYLSRSFKACTGLSFVTYLNHLKVERAKELLLELSNISLEIAQMAVTPEGEDTLPAWFLAEVVRELPALAKRQG